MVTPLVLLTILQCVVSATPDGNPQHNGSTQHHCRDSYPQATNTITVHYQIDYLSPGSECHPGYPAPADFDLVVQANSTALRVLEESVDAGPDYRFTATYYNTLFGYYIEVINGTGPYPPCFWDFVVKFPNGSEIEPGVGVSAYRIPSDGYSVIMRYMKNGSTYKMVNKHNQMYFKP